MTTDLKVFIAVSVLSEANRREHWAQKARRVRAQRLAAKLAVSDAIFRAPPYSMEPRRRIQAMRELQRRLRTEPVVVRLEVVRGRVLDDDNLVSGLKAVRDGIADALHRSDRQTLGLTFEPPTQRTESAKAKHGVVASLRLGPTPTGLEA